MRMLLHKLVEQYRSRGIVKGHELLLPPDFALQMLEELTENSIVVVDCSIWTYIDREKGWIIEIPYSGLRPEVTEATLVRNRVVAEFVKAGLPDNVDFVSFVFLKPEVADIIDEALHE